jgi:hypothetical protein
VATLIAAARAGDHPAIPRGCERQDVVFRPERRVPTAPFAAEVVGLDSYAARDCERLSRQQGPCPVARRQAAVFEGRAQRPSGDAWEQVQVILDARIAFGPPAPPIPPAVLDGPVGTPPAVLDGPVRIGPSVLDGPVRIGPSVMDGPASGGYEVGLADRSPLWLLPPPTMPPNGTGTPR